MAEILSSAQADFINNQMPGNQVVRLGTILKYAIDQINDITDSGTDSVKFDNSIVPVYGQDQALVSIGTWNTPMTVTPDAAYAPLQVNLTNATNVSGDLAAARLKLITTGACAATNLNVLELRETIGGNINQWATLQASCAPGAHAITTGEGLVGYFAMDGTGTITPAGSNAVAVLEAINNHTGAGVSDVAIFRNNATGFGAGNIVKVENIIGTATNALYILRTAGTVTNGINIKGTMTNDINFQSGSTISDASHLDIETLDDTKRVRLNERNYAATSGDIVGFSSKPAANASGTQTVYGAQISPRANDNIDVAAIVGLQVEPIMKGATGLALSGDLRGLDVRLTSEGANNVGGIAGAIFCYNLLKTATFTGGVYPIVVKASGDTQAWTALMEIPTGLSAAADGGGAAVYIPITINGVAAKITAKYVS